MIGKEYVALLDVSERQRQDIIAGGRLNHVRAALGEDSR